MTVKVEIASDADATTWEDITDLVYLETARWAGTASRGEIDTGSGFNWRDDAGTRVIPWRRRVRVTEDATTPDTVIWQGRTVGDEVRRGPVLTDDAKMFDVNLVDVNADFGGMPFAGVQRPAESDVDRIDYLLDTYIGSGQNRPSTVIGDAYFNRSIPYALTAHLYSGVQLIDWFTHMTDTTGRDFFLTKDYDLFHDIPAATSYAATIAITDDSPDYSTSFPPILPEATEDATEMFTGVRFRWKSGTVTVTRSSVETANDQWRTTVVDESVLSAAAATTKANVFLDEFDHSRTSFRCSVQLPADMVDALSWGMTVSFRSAAVGVLTPTTYRITRLSWGLVGEGMWQADMEINYASKFRRASNPGTPPVVGPVPFTPSPSQNQVVTVQEQVSQDIVFDSGAGWVTPGTGSLLVLWHSTRSLKTPTAPSGFTAHPSGTVDGMNDRGGMFYKIADGTESTITASMSAGDRHVATLVEFPGTWTLVDDDETSGTGTGISAGTVTPTSGKRALIVGGVVDQTSDTPSSVTTAAGWTELCDRMADDSGFGPLSWMVYKIVSSASGSYNPTGTASNAGSGWGGQTLAFVTDDEPATPTQGQPVTETATGDGSTTSFTTSHPYAAGSLVVTVNGINVDDAITETDPSTGDFDFDTAPPFGAEIVIRYLGAPA